MGDEETQSDETESKHGIDSADKGQDAEGSKQADNPSLEDIEGTGGEGDDQGGLGDRTGGSGGAVAEETEEGTTKSGELRK